jgi:3-hydroxyisobutyrate dehydrogenase-like beta-hydroxyacid dehydrogenase
MISQTPIIGFIGFGEVAYNVSIGLKESGIEHILTYTRGVNIPHRRPEIGIRAQRAGVELTQTLEELVSKSEIVISAVHGDVALDFAEEAARFILPERIFADLNNATPAAKVLGSEMINANGGKFVDIGLFETTTRVKHKALMYVSGDGAEEFKSIMSPYGMNIELIPGGAGKATTIKTLANIYIKGIQALCLEVAISAQKTGIDPDILGPLLVRPVRTLPKEDEMAFWILRGGLSASRKVPELQGIVHTLKEWDVDPIMVEATLNRLTLAASFNLSDQLLSEMELDDYQAIIKAMADSQ